MNKAKKIGICAAVMAGVGILSFAMEKCRRKWFAKGYDAGSVIGGMAVAEELTEQFAEQESAIVKKYNKLCDEYDELERAYDELCDSCDECD